MMKKVKVIIDRPKGSYHPTHTHLYYPINYGYVEGVIAGDGEEQDAYILGVNQPVQEFVGVLYAIVHRLDDVEDKWIVVPEGYQLSEKEIEESIAFQEKYFEHVLFIIGEQKNETSH